MTITASNFGLGGTIVETLPTGFNYVGSDAHVADFDADTREIKIGLISIVPKVSYTVTVPEVEGVYTFDSGVVTDFDRREESIGGASMITVAAEPTDGQGAGDGSETTAPTVTRSFSASSVSVGDTLTVTIEIADYDGFARIVETLPDGVDYDGSENFDADTRELTLTRIDESSINYSVTARTRGTQSFSGVLIDGALKRHTIEGSNTVTVEDAPGPTVTRSFSPSSVSVGETLTVTIEIANYEGFARIVETLPDGVDYDGSENFDADTRELTLTRIDESSINYSVTAHTRGTQSFSGVLIEGALKRHTIEGSNTVTVEDAPGPTVTRSFSPSSVSVGETLTVTIEIANYEGFARIVETLPDGVDYDGSENFDADTRELTLTRIDESSINYSVTARTRGTQSFSGVLIEGALKRHTIEGSNTVTVEDAPGPTVTRSFSPSSVSVGETLTVTIEIANYEGFARIVETLPDGVDYDGSENFDADTRELTLTRIDESSINYSVTVRTRGTHRFSGVLIEGTLKRHTIAGSSRITVGTPPTVMGPTVTPRHSHAHGHARGRVAERPRLGLLPRPHLPHHRPRPRPCLPRRLRQRRRRPRLRPRLPRRPRLRPRLPLPRRRRLPLRRLRRDFRQLGTHCHSGWSRWRSSVCYWPSEERCCLRISCLGRRTHTRGTGRVCGASRQI